MEDLLRLARKGRLPDVEGAWMRALEAETVPWQAMLQAAEALADREGGGQAESLLWYLLTALRDRDNMEAAFAVALRAGELLPHSDLIRDEAAELYASLRGESPHTQTLLQMTLRNPRLPLNVAVQDLQRLERLSAGTYVREDPGARFGRVEGLDAERQELLVAFPDGAAGYDAAAARKLQIVPEDDFRALLAFERERLEALAEEDPEGLVTLVLKTFGPRVQLVRLKRHVQFVVGEDAWQKWWAGAKRVLERSRVIGLTEGRKPDLFLRARPQGQAERLRAAFDGAEPLNKLALALDVLDERTEETEWRLPLLEHFAREIATLAAGAPAASPGMALAAMAVLERIKQRAPQVNLPDTITPAERIARVDVVKAICDELVEARVLLPVLEALVRWAPDRWWRIYAAAMPCLAEEACRWAARKLSAAGHVGALAEAGREVLRRPDSHPGALLWLWKAWDAGEFRAAVAGLDRRAVLRRLLAEGTSRKKARATSSQQRRRFLTQVRQALLSRGGAGVREALQGASDQEMQAVASIIERNQGFTNQARAELGKLIRSCRPELFHADVPPWAEKVIYTTAEGLARRRAELNRITHERLPQVIRELGAAAGFGDITDNAEYTAALEERNRLSERASAIREELMRSRLITRELASVPHVTVGSRVRARNLETGAIETFTFLGPWDADPAAGVYSYRAPLSHAFMGRAAGESVTFTSADGERRWEILEVAPAL